MECDKDNDYYNIDPAEREIVVNNVLQVANSANSLDKEEKKPLPVNRANVQPYTPSSGSKANTLKIGGFPFPAQNLRY